MLLELKSDYLNGKIDKQNYISEMYKTHSILWDYVNLIKHSEVETIKISEEGVFMSTKNGIMFEVPSMDERVVPIEMLNFGNYEQNDWKIMVKLLSLAQAKNIMDIGANIGYVSLLLSRELDIENIICFEPIKSTYDYLCKNIELNNANIKAENIGLSDTSGELTYYFYPEGSGNSSLKNLSDRPNVEKVQAKVDTLDNYIVDNSIKNVDFMKLDVEGAEFLVLKGGVNFINNQKPIIYAELLRKWSKPFNYRPNDVLEWLRNIGYKAYAMAKDGLIQIEQIDENTVETNFVFLHKESHEELINYIKNK